MIERPTEEIKTSDGHTIVIKSFLTYREMEPIMQKDGMNNVAKGAEILKIALISVDGISENPWEALQDLPVSNYTEVANKTAKMMTGDFQPAK